MIPLVIDPAYVERIALLIHDRALPGHERETVSHRPWIAQDYAQLATEFSSVVFRADDTAIVPITGPIDYRRSIMSEMGFMTSSEAVRSDFRRLMADESVSRIVFDIDSPGGLYSGLPELARDVFQSRGTKRTVAVANPLAASGALWLGAAAEKFYVLGSGQVGSVGAVMLHSDLSRAYDEMGVTHTILRDPEGKADFNPLEPLSEESRQHHQQIVSDIAKEFTASIAKFRGVTAAQAASQFGRGRVMGAEDAVQAGLVDGIVDSVQSVLGPRIQQSKRRPKLHARLEIARINRLTRGSESA